jgi:isocitrate dehydrogenase
VFVESPLSAAQLGPSLEQAVEGSPIKLKMISNRGTKVYTPTGAITDCVDVWRCRFIAREAAADLNEAHVADLLQRVAAKHAWMHVEKLQEFDGEMGYTKAQGED